MGKYTIYINDLPYKIEPPSVEEARNLKRYLTKWIKQHKPKKKAVGRPRLVEVRRILNLRGEGLSMDQIAKRLKISKGSVHYCIKKENSR